MGAPWEVGRSEDFYLRGQSWPGNWDSGSGISKTSKEELETEGSKRATGSMGQAPGPVSCPLRKVILD